VQEAQLVGPSPWREPPQSAVKVPGKVAEAVPKVHISTNHPAKHKNMGSWVQGDGTGPIGVRA
jgi:hypothetical protein